MQQNGSTSAGLTRRSVRGPRHPHRALLRRAVRARRGGGGRAVRAVEELGGGDLEDKCRHLF